MTLIISEKFYEHYNHEKEGANISYFLKTFGKSEFFKYGVLVFIEHTAGIKVQNAFKIGKNVKANMRSCFTAMTQLLNLLKGSDVFYSVEAKAHISCQCNISFWAYKSLSM